MPSQSRTYYPSSQPTMTTSPSASTAGSEAALMSKAQRSRAAETGFFDAITQKMRRGRSTSRNRIEKSRSRSRSPLPITLPPEQISAPRAAPMSPTQAPPRPQQPRHVSTTSQSSIQVSQSPMSPTRPPTQHRRSSDLWHGRQTNNWLFNDFSFTQTVKDIVHHHHSGEKSP
jgi:hypothetical protein